MPQSVPTAALLRGHGHWFPPGNGTNRFNMFQVIPCWFASRVLLHLFKSKTLQTHTHHNNWKTKCGFSSRLLIKKRNKGCKAVSYDFIHRVVFPCPNSSPQHHPLTVRPSGPTLQREFATSQYVLPDCQSKIAPPWDGRSVRSLWHFDRKRP